ncbi:MAG: hypothetical protein WC346_13155 [Methanogenium sp.]|jgi:hypothetical protein
MTEHLELPEPERLPKDFKIGAYLEAFKMLAPVDGVFIGQTDKQTIYYANVAFMNQIKKMTVQGFASYNGKSFIISRAVKSVFVNLNVLPIAIYCGAVIVFK